ncbi:Methionyl-tRNA formyltransferase [Ceratobasidium sp. 395]|nr:Methionyl-tRNA formyltransferase [Ceratobasidium sp. 395]
MEDGKGFDFGDMWAQQEFKIPKASTYMSLEPELARIGGQLLVHVLRQAKADPGNRVLVQTFTASPQDHARATKARLIKAEQSEIQWSSWDAFRVERTHRAIGHQRPVFTTMPDNAKSRLQLLEMRIEPDRMSELRFPGDAIYEPCDNFLRVECANQTQLVVSIVKSENKNALKIKEWWNGIPAKWLDNGVLKLGSVA